MELPDRSHSFRPTLLSRCQGTRGRASDRVHHHLLPRVRDLVPDADNRLGSSLVFKGEHTHARGSAVEKTALPPEAGRATEQRSFDDVSTRKCENIPLDSHDASDDPIGSGGDIFGGLAFGAAVTAPTWAVPSEFPEEATPLVSSVIPLDECRHDRTAPKPASSQVFEAAATRAGEDGREENRLSRLPNWPARSLLLCSRGYRSVRWRG